MEKKLRKNSYVCVCVCVCITESFCCILKHYGSTILQFLQKKIWGVLKKHSMSLPYGTWYHSPPPMEEKRCFKHMGPEASLENSSSHQMFKILSERFTSRDI